MSSIKQLLLKVHALVPDVCKDNRQYSFTKELIDNSEPELTIEMFLELADETQEIFPPEYWELLAEAGRKMKIMDIDNLIRIYKKS